MNTKTRRLKETKKIIGKCLSCSKPITKNDSVPNLLDTNPNWGTAACLDCMKTYAWVRHLMVKIRGWVYDN